MTDRTKIASDLRGLVSAARAAGQLPELVAELKTLLASLERAPAPTQSAEVPMRFGMVGASPAMKRVFALLERVAPSDVPVLIYGETGTGKELVARALHLFSRRKSGPFLAENCAAVAPTLLESELFGHKKGSFTDAHADRAGHFVAAHKGTLFLDEVGDMPLAMQAKLLRVLEEGEVRPVGSSEVVRVDVRIVAATHRDLARLVEERKFRQDLLYRLNVVRIDLPPLRERAGDVEHLVRYFLARLGPELGVESPRVTPAALATLGVAPWPGNVRQLENELRRALTLSGGFVDVRDLSPGILGRG
jgi:transcriptional regulator with GAF, ATPase, and Fis domain